MHAYLTSSPIASSTFASTFSRRFSSALPAHFLRTMRPVLRACAKRPCVLQATNNRRPQWSKQACRNSSNNTTDPKETAGPEPPPFHGYLIDALDAPLHTITAPTHTSPAPPPPSQPPESPEEEKLAKARVVFGSRLAGPAERKREIEKVSERIAGILVPPRPEEPENCCMSGCVNCVWDLYREELEEWAAKSAEAKARVRAMEAGGEDDGMGSGMEMGMGGAGEEGGGLFEGIPVGIREFMRTEKKLKARHLAEGSVPG